MLATVEIASIMSCGVLKGKERKLSALSPLYLAQPNNLVYTVYG